MSVLLPSPSSLLLVALSTMQCDSLSHCWSKFGQDSSFESLGLPHAVLVELHSWGSGDSKEVAKIEPGFA